MKTWSRVVTGLSLAAAALFASFAEAQQGVGSVTVDAGGSGYTSAPTVTFSGGEGSGAAATATLAPRGVESVMMEAAGVYNYNPNVTFGPPQTAGGVQATGTAIRDGFNITGVTITNPGSGYTSPPSVTFQAGLGGTNARATAVLETAAVESVTLTSGGSGYTSAPAVRFEGGGGSGATARARLAPRPVPPPPPEPPAGVETTSDAGGSVTISWAHPGDPDIASYEYLLQRAGRTVGDWRTVPGSDADTTSVTVDLTTGEARAVNNATPPVEWTILLRARDRNGNAGGIARTTVAAAGTTVPAVPAAWLGVQAVLLWALRGRTLRRRPRHRRRTCR